MYGKSKRCKRHRRAKALSRRPYLDQAVHQAVLARSHEQSRVEAVAMALLIYDVGSLVFMLCEDVVCTSLAEETVQIFRCSCILQAEATVQVFRVSLEHEVAAQGLILFAS